MSNKSFGEKIRSARKEKQLSLNTVSHNTTIDTAILSKIERGKRMATKIQVEKLADFFHANKKEWIVEWLSEKLSYELRNEEDAIRVLQVAEEKVEYKSFLKTDRKRIIKRIQLILKRFEGIKKAWIYGSFSREDDEPKSDIDIAVKTVDSFSYFDLAEVQYQLEKGLNRKIDIGFIDSFKPHILENIKSDLKVIYEKKQSY